MKNLIGLLLIGLASCSPTSILPLMGNYVETPVIIRSENSFDKTWDKLIDVFAQKGLSIKIIDRSSGLIISTPYKMPATMEKEKSGLVDPTAYVVVPSIRVAGRREPISGTNSGPYSGESKIKAEDVMGQWNVRVKSAESGSTINVNITDVYYTAYSVGYGNAYATRIPSQTPLSTYKSTGVFEKQLSDLIK